MKIHVTIENKWLAEQISQKNHFLSFYGNWKIDHWRELRLCGVVRALEYIMTGGGAVKMSLRSGKNADSEAEQ